MARTCNGPVLRQKRSYALVNVGWQRAWESLEGTYDGFLSDLERAWRQAEDAGACARSVMDRGRAIGLQCRYALIVASIKSLVGNIPPALLAALVDKSVWTPVQGLAYVRQMSDKTQQVKALTVLVPHLSAPSLREALASARAIEDEAQALTVIPRLGALGYAEEALAAAQAIQYGEYLAQALTGLAPYLSEPLLREALAAALAIEDKGNRVQALAGLTPYLSESLRVAALQEALAAAQAIQYGKYRALAGLAPHLSEPLLREALAAALAIEDKGDREEALAGLAPCLSEPLLHEALAAALAIEYKGDREEELTRLIPRLGALGYREEALAMVRAMDDAKNRARALVGLAPQLSEPLRIVALHEALAAVQAIYEGSLDERKLVMRMLVELAPHLSEPLLREALAETRESIWGESGRAEALEALALRLGALGYGEKALAAARAIASESQRAEVLTELAPYLPEPLRMATLQEALGVASVIKDKSVRAEVLVRLAPQLPEPLRMAVFQEALAAARAIANESQRAEVLTELAQYLPKPLQRTVLQEALADRSGY